MNARTPQLEGVDGKQEPGREQSAPSRGSTPPRSGSDCRTRAVSSGCVNVTVLPKMLQNCVPPV